MSSSGSPSTTQLVVTGLLSFSMAVMAYYLHVDSKKPRLVPNDDSNYNGKNVSMSWKPRATMAEKQTHGTPARTLAASATSGTDGSGAAPEVPELVFPSPKKAAKARVEETVRLTNKVAEPFGVNGASKELSSTCSADKSGIANPPVLDLLSQPVTTIPREQFGPTKTPEEATKEIAAASYQVSEHSSAATLASSNKLSANATESVEATETEDSREVRKQSDEFTIIAQVATESASAFTDDFLQKSLDNAALELEEYVQVELSQSMTLSQSTPEPISVAEEEMRTQELDQMIEESIATEEKTHSLVEPTDQGGMDIEAATDVAALSKTLALGANATPQSQTAITSSAVAHAATTDEKLTPKKTMAGIEGAAVVSSGPPAESDEVCGEENDTTSLVTNEDTPSDKRHRNRSKKSKSKNKKGKQHTK